MIKVMYKTKSRSELFLIEQDCNDTYVHAPSKHTSSMQTVEVFAKPGCSGQRTQKNTK
jgi:hypothetical protein